MSEGTPLPRIAVLGGTGDEGRGLAYRWARAGYAVILGSRSVEKAHQAAADLLRLLPGSASVIGLANADAAAQADIVVLSVPYAAHAATLASVKPAMAGKLLIDVTVPLVPPKVTKVQMPAAGSAAQEARDLLGNESEVAAAFHTISHEYLMRHEPVDSEVLVTGTTKQARAQALQLVSAAGLVGWDAGPIENSSVTEGLTSILININKLYGSTHAGLRITGVPRE